MPKITPDITEEANKVYKNLPSHIKKGEWVSDAIIEKHERDTGISPIQQLKDDISELKDRVEKIERMMGK